MFQLHCVCPVQGCPCFPRLHCSGSRLLYMERALRWVQFQFSDTPQKRGFGCACVLCLPGPEQFRQLGAWVHSPRVWRAFSLCGRRTCCRSGLRKSLDRNWGPVCSVGGGWLLRGWVCPFPLPPASFLQQGWPALLWSFSVPLFCERPAVCLGWLVFSLALPQFKTAPSDCSQGLRPALTLSNAARSSLFCPRPLCWRVQASGVLFCWELLLGT